MTEFSWREKYERLMDTFLSLQQTNQFLEEQILTVVNKREADKIILSNEIDDLTSQLYRAKMVQSGLQDECARYKSDCILAVNLLQCQPSIAVNESKFHEIVHDTHTSNATAADMFDDITPKKDMRATTKLVDLEGSNPSSSGTQHEKFNVNGTAFQYAQNRSMSNPLMRNLAKSRDPVSDRFVQRILSQPAYECVRSVVQCTRCGQRVLHAEAQTQTDNNGDVDRLEAFLGGGPPADP